ncbi:bifunctional chorismate mutase/prephenate dehydrogenase [Thalassotalea sp. LPB0316]|uniref:bifunctional chorismate mutase/prephenate dehydrogenase n=1 Tax=Thalassotalea sp. LPB0316 TaxID=2769490 RepID=UPI001867C711|nr:bifunctional chorismate mutase/prephenate dehydrogenase [Thalassotalea sp. LPB0316]QOL26941.1 bifunctional chorismate mutase/prephenate dehydrogenase [Thalassotalea sp. LPB0316]
MKDFEPQLIALRDQIDEIDQALVELLAKRRLVTRQVGKLKSEVGKPIFDPEREAALIDKRRQQASAAGVNADLIEDVLRRIMRDSYQSQDESGYLSVHQTPKNVVVIGGAGQLGSIFVDLFKRTKYRVDIIEQADWPMAEPVLAKADLVIVSVPIRITPFIIQQLNNLPSDCILADVTSVKESPLYEMMKVHQGPVVGLHPMFGPDVTGLVKQTIIMCEGREPERYQWLLDQLKIWGAKIYPVSAHEHDQAMSMVQVMRHFSTIAYGYHLMTEGANLQQLVDMSSPIYRLEIIMVGRLFAQDPVLYTDIIFANPENISMMKRFAYRFLELLEDVEMGDKEDFITMFNQVSDWFGDYADIFLSESKSMLLKANELKKD